MSTAPPLRDLIAGGVELASGSIYYETAEAALTATSDHTDLSLTDELLSRKARLTLIKNRLVLDIQRRPDEELPGWYPANKSWLQRVLADLPIEPDAPEDIRHTIRHREAEAWFARIRGRWTRLTSGLIKMLLQYHGHTRSEAEVIMGQMVNAPWELVCIPFAPEYEDGIQEWNRGAPQLIYEGKHGPHPSWDRILGHCFLDLDTTIQADPWCQRHGIRSGRDYGVLWLAAMVQEPTEQVPFLFLYGNQNCGKSIFHEAVTELVTHGVVDASRALTAEHNGELEGAVLAYIEERELPHSAYNRLKDWVTAKRLSIRRMRTDSYQIANTLHWVMMANSLSYCPVFPGDTRITVSHVPDLAEDIPKPVLLKALKAEAPAFTYTLKTTKLPPHTGRLRVPVIENHSKSQVIDSHIPPIVKGAIDLAPWSGTRTELAAECDCKLSGRAVKTTLDKHAKYLKQHGVEAEFPDQRTAKGKMVRLTK